MPWRATKHVEEIEWDVDHTYNRRLVLGIFSSHQGWLIQLGNDLGDRIYYHLSVVDGEIET